MDRDGSARRIERDIETLAGPDYTLSDEAVRRYAYTPEYRNTLDGFTRELEAIDSPSRTTRSGRSTPATGQGASRCSGSARTATPTGTAAATTGRWASSPPWRSAG